MHAHGLRFTWRKQRPLAVLRHQFSLVELMLAIVVVVVGFIGIMALLPAGQNRNKEAVAQTSAGDIGEHFLRHMTSQLKSNWEVINVIPVGKLGGEVSEANASWASTDSGGIFQNTLIEGTQISYNDMDGDGKLDYRIDADAGDTARDNSGIFRVVQKSSNNAVDFEGVIRVWRTAATYKAYDTAGTTWSGLKPVPPDAGTTLNVEVSYPAAAPYANRSKKTYKLDVFRPSEAALSAVKGAFTIGRSGKLKFTFHGSSAGLTSGLFMSYPEVVEVFEENQVMAQNTEVELDFEPGTAFNFFSRTYAASWGLGTYDHYAWGEQDSDSPAFAGVPYFDVMGNSTGAYDHVTGNPYCMVTELTPGSKWLLGFEDLPGWYPPDWDYNDIVVTAELIGTDQSGVSTTGHTITGTIKLENNPSWRFDLTRADGTLLNMWNLTAADDGSTYAAIALWTRPLGNGTQSITVDGTATPIDNVKMTAISSPTMTVRLYKSAGKWHAQILNATDAVITTME